MRTTSQRAISVQDFDTTAETSLVRLPGATEVPVGRNGSHREEPAACLGQILESAVEHAIITVSEDRTVVSWNAGATALFGYSADEIRGCPADLLFIPEDRETDVPRLEMNRVKVEGRAADDRWMQRKDGTRFWARAITLPLIGTVNARSPGLLKIVTDETETKIARDNLSLSREVLAQALIKAEQAQRAAETTGQAKDNFLASLSHELRTPLNPILLLASNAASDPSLPENIRTTFRTIQKSAELEKLLIDDLLDLTGIVRGKIVLRQDTVEVHEVIRDAIATLRGDLDSKRVRLELHLDAAASCLTADAARLQQVFLNLLKNAVKFTPAGGLVTISTQNPQSDLVEIQVADNGLGITAEEQSRIFNAFEQGEHALAGGSAKYGGLGLGLAIARRLAALHGGQLAAHSAGRNQGSTFILSLPICSRPHAASAPPSLGGAVQSQIQQILLIEDHEPTRAALQALLGSRGFMIVAKGTAAEARDAAKKLRFDLVISDVGLPDCDGKILMSELRDRHGLKGIALTGYGTDRDIAECYAAGFTKHLIKPVRIESLLETLSSFGET